MYTGTPGERAPYKSRICLKARGVLGERLKYMNILRALFHKCAFKDFIWVPSGHISRQVSSDLEKGREKCTLQGKVTDVCRM